MTKRLLCALSALLIGVLLFGSLVSCGSDPASAYDLAVSEGFVGSEAEWLASLHGKDMDIDSVYLKAKENGFEGTFLDFLTEYLSLDPEMVSEAILAREEKNNAQKIAYSLLSSVSIRCSSLTGSVGSSAGSGVILSLDRAQGNAMILTNYHVVIQNGTDAKPFSEILVQLYGSDTGIRATYIGGTYTYDIAVLLIRESTALKNSDALPVSVASSDTLFAGQNVFAIGNATGGGISVTRGVVSIPSKEATITATSGNARKQRLVQIDAPINEGNSGGGLFDENGNLVALVNSKVEKEGVENIGYAIPSDIAVRVANSLIDAQGKSASSRYFIFDAASLSVARLGVELEAKDSIARYDEETKTTYIDEKVTVVGFGEGSSLAKSAGVATGDIIRSITVDGARFQAKHIYTVQDAMLLCRVGSTVTLEIDRGGKNVTVVIPLPATAFLTVI